VHRTSKRGHVLPFESLGDCRHAPGALLAEDDAELSQQVLVVTEPPLNLVLSRSRKSWAIARP
jgi:hypothetical protein